jgi:N-acetyl-gamma-glutamyl-phosphate reductase
MVITAAIVGATGYTGAELTRLLLAHPGVELLAVTSRSALGRRVDEVFANLRGHTNLVFTELEIEALNACDVVFFATPHGIAMSLAPELLSAGLKVVDLSADFRLKDPDLWQQWYGLPHASPDLLPQAVYGLPEANRTKVQSAQLVANPGCYPTAVLLGLLPLIEEGLVNTTRLIADVKSGVSGAGRKAQVHTLMGEIGENFKAYNVAGHRHLQEITQLLNGLSDDDVQLIFVPHLVPMIRGIHATLYASLHTETPDVYEVYADRYAGEPFVDVMPIGSHPETRHVRGTNHCKISVHHLPSCGSVVILTVIDNLIKGAAGQAVQNMNLMFGLEETLGLEEIGLFP